MRVLWPEVKIQSAVLHGECLQSKSFKLYTGTEKREDMFMGYLQTKNINSTYIGNVLNATKSLNHFLFISDYARIFNTYKSAIKPMNIVLRHFSYK